MANYSLVVNSKFKPFSFERYMQPYQLYKQAYEEVENAYSTLSMDAETLRKRAEAESDSAWASKYKEFADSLQSQADALSKYGLNSSTRGVLMNAKRNYSSNIVPIKSAIARQSELAKLASSQNPALRMINGAMPTIDQLIENPTIERTGYSGADIEKSAMTSAAAASARHQLESFARDPRNAGFMKQVKEVGYNLQTLEEMKNHPALQNIINQVKAQYGYEGDNTLSRRDKDRLDAEILSGLFKGVAYQKQTSYQQDPVYMANLHAALQERAAIRAAERENSKRLKEGNSIPIVDANLASPRTLGEGARRKASFATRVLGIDKMATGKTNNKYLSKGQVKETRPNILSALGFGSNEVIYARNKSNSTMIDMYDKNGRILSRKEYVNQGRTEKDKKILLHNYNSTIIPALRNLGVSDKNILSGNTPNIHQLVNNFKSINTNLGASNIGALEVRFRHPEEVFQKTFLPKLLDNDGKDTNIYELTDWDNAGNFVKGKKVKKSDFIDSDGKIVGTPLFYASPSNKNEMIMRFNGKMYSIPYSKIGASIVGETYGIDIETLREAQAEKKKYIEQHGEGAYYNSKVGGVLEDIINSSGGNYIKSIHNLAHDVEEVHYTIK